MQTKLTLRLDARLIHLAKIYAHETGKSLSQLVADYFQLIHQPQLDTAELSPLTASLKGILKSDTSPVSQADYRDYLRRKHQ